MTVQSLKEKKEKKKHDKMDILNQQIAKMSVVKVVKN